jgi:hypothetical protein
LAKSSPDPQDNFVSIWRTSLAQVFRVFFNTLCCPGRKKSIKSVFYQFIIKANQCKIVLIMDHSNCMPQKINL